MWLFSTWNIHLFRFIEAWIQDYNINNKCQIVKSEPKIDCLEKQFILPNQIGASLAWLHFASSEKRLCQGISEIP